MFALVRVYPELGFQGVEVRRRDGGLSVDEGDYGRRHARQLGAAKISASRGMTRIFKGYN
jgi:hypothetical protein